MREPFHLKPVSEESLSCLNQTMDSICRKIYKMFEPGYMIVEDRGEHSINTLSLVKIYKGVNRLAWVKFMDEYYDHKLPNMYLSIASRLHDKNSNFETLISIEDAEFIYKDFYRESGDLVYLSNDLIKGEFEFLGIDLCISQNWSLILGGYFSEPLRFSNCDQIINSNGLLDKLSDVTTYISTYLSLMDLEIVEEIGNVGEIEAISVFQVKRSENK